MNIICPKNLVSMVAYPLGYVLGISSEVIDFDIKFKKSFLGSRIPISLSCSLNEFYDCLELSKKLNQKLELKIIDLKEKKEEEIEFLLKNCLCKTFGYINCDIFLIEKIFEKLDFRELAGNHIFHLPYQEKFDHNNIHIFLKPLKYRTIDAILSIYLWAENMKEKIDYNLFNKVVLEENFVDTEDLINNYIKIISSKNLDSFIKFDFSQELSYKEFLEKSEKEYLVFKLKQNDGNLLKTSKILGMSRNTLKKKVQNYYEC